MISSRMKQTANSIRGCEGIILLGRDGFVVEKHSIQVENAENLVVELLGILKKLDALFSRDSASASQNVLTIEGNHNNYFLKPVLDDYYLFMITDKTEFTGKCQYELDKAAIQLAKEMC